MAKEKRPAISRAHLATPREPARPLSKRDWQDIRRALNTQPRADVHAVELHSVKIIYMHKKGAMQHPGPKADRSGDSPESKRQGASEPRRGADSTTVDPAGKPTERQQRNSSQRRSHKRMQEFLERKRAEAAATSADATMS